MTFRVNTFFNDLVDHLRSRADAITSLSVMCAIERWVQWEAAYLLDTRRDSYGLGGGAPANPDWWIVCEYQNVDIWAAHGAEGIALEVKAIHNNKNFYGKVAELRNDLTPALKHVPATASTVARYGLLLVTYAQYVDSTRYQVLRARKRGPAMAHVQFEKELLSAISSDDPWYGDSVGLKLAQFERIASLDGARYIVPGHGCAVWLGLAAEA